MENRQLRKNLSNIFLKGHIEKIAKNSKFKMMSSGKLDPESFLWLSCFMCTSSLEELCTSLLLNKDIDIFPQALDQRIKTSSAEFLKKIFLEICKKQN